MQTNWQEFLSAAGARFDAAKTGELTDFGDPSGEVIAARDATVISPLAHLGLIGCSGEDARAFLHNQLTSDVNHLDAQAAQHAAWCTAKGRMLASLVLYRSDDGYRALLAADLTAATLKRLQIYVLRAKVKLADLSSDYVAIGLSCADPATGADALAAAGLPVPAKALQSAAFADGHVIRLDDNRLLVVVACAAAAALWGRLAERARPVGVAAWRWLDVRAGLPLISEATREAFVPQMADFDKIGGVAFNKGCYPGQEVVARTHYLGKIKRHLYRLHTDAEAAAGALLFAAASGDAEHACGQVVSAAPAPDGSCAALAVIQEDFADAPLAVGAADGARVRRVEAVHAA